MFPGPFPVSEASTVACVTSIEAKTLVAPLVQARRAWRYLIVMLGLFGAATPIAATAQTPIADSPPWTMPGREEDGRAARIAFRIARAGRARCAVTEGATGLVLQHLTQFPLSERARLAAAFGLDRGPIVNAIVPGSPAVAAGVQVGDILLAIDDRPLPPEAARDLAFDAARAHARADAIADLLTGTAPALTLRRGDAEFSTVLRPETACASRVHLARSGQRNAYADGRHVFLTTGLLARLRSDDELAFVIAHEMAHNVLRHAAILRGGDGQREPGMSRPPLALVEATERAADTLAGEIMLDAGYDPVGGAALLERFDGLRLFDAHDSAGARVAAMRRLAAARAMP